MNLQHKKKTTQDDSSHLSLQRKKRGTQSTFSQTPFSKGFDHSFGTTPTQTGPATSAIMRMPNPLSPAPNPAGIIMRTPSSGFSRNGAGRQATRSRSGGTQTNSQTAASGTQTSTQTANSGTQANPRTSNSRTQANPQTATSGTQTGVPVFKDDQPQATKDGAGSGEQSAAATNQGSPLSGLAPLNPDAHKPIAPSVGADLRFVGAEKPLSGDGSDITSRPLPASEGQMYPLPAGSGIRASLQTIELSDIKDKFQDLWFNSDYLANGNFDEFFGEMVNQANIQQAMQAGTEWWSAAKSLEDLNWTKRNVSIGLRVYVLGGEGIERYQGEISSIGTTQNQQSDISEHSQSHQLNIEAHGGDPTKGGGSVNYGFQDMNRQSSSNIQGGSNTNINRGQKTSDEANIKIGMELFLRTETSNGRFIGTQTGFVENAGSLTVDVSNLEALVNGVPRPIPTESTDQQASPAAFATDTAALDETSVVEMHITRAYNGSYHDGAFGGDDEPYIKLTHAGKSKDTHYHDISRGGETFIRRSLTELSDDGLINEPITVELYDWDDSDSIRNADDLMVKFTWDPPYDVMHASGEGYSITATVLRRIPKNNRL